MKEDVFGLNLMVIFKRGSFLMLFVDALPHRLFRDGFPMLELPKHLIFESGFTGFIG
jgi:hypothetical protein